MNEGGIRPITSEVWPDWKDQPLPSRGQSMMALLHPGLHHNLPGKIKQRRWRLGPIYSPWRTWSPLTTMSCGWGSRQPISEMNSAALSTNHGNWIPKSLWPIGMITQTNRENRFLRRIPVRSLSQYPWLICSGHRVYWTMAESQSPVKTDILDEVQEHIPWTAKYSHSGQWRHTTYLSKRLGGRRDGETRTTTAHSEGDSRSRRLRCSTRGCQIHCFLSQISARVYRCPMLLRRNAWYLHLQFHPTCPPTQYARTFQHSTTPSPRNRKWSS